MATSMQNVLNNVQRYNIPLSNTVTTNKLGTSVRTGKPCITYERAFVFNMDETFFPSLRIQIEAYSGNNVVAVIPEGSCQDTEIIRDMLLTQGIKEAGICISKQEVYFNVDAAEIHTVISAVIGAYFTLMERLVSINRNSFSLFDTTVMFDNLPTQHCRKTVIERNNAESWSVITTFYAGGDDTTDLTFDLLEVRQYIERSGSKMRATKLYLETGRNEDTEDGTMDISLYDADHNTFPKRAVLNLMGPVVTTYENPTRPMLYQNVGPTTVVADDSCKNICGFLSVDNVLLRSLDFKLTFEVSGKKSLVSMFAEKAYGKVLDSLPKVLGTFELRSLGVSDNFISVE